jgi:pentapeptide repeat protein
VLRWLRSVRWRRPRWLLIAFLALGLILLLLWALVTVPALILGVDQIQVARKIQDPAKQLDEVNGLRSTLAGVLAGLAVAAGAIVGALNFGETSRQNRAVLELQRRGQVTERFSKAVEQLGDEKLDVQIGAVYAMEQIARDSAELHWPIMEVLTAYLREHRTPSAPIEDQVPLTAVQQAILTVVGRRRVAQDTAGDRLDLHATHLFGAILGGADLRGANLRGADLRRANLRGANLGGADLGGAILVGAILDRAILGGADLGGTILFGADLRGAILRGVDLRGAIGLTAEQLADADSVEDAPLPPELVQWSAQTLGDPTAPKTVESLDF